jgi:hypothetical protein
MLSTRVGWLWLSTPGLTPAIGFVPMHFPSTLLFLHLFPLFLFSSSHRYWKGLAGRSKQKTEGKKGKGKKGEGGA